MGKGPFGGKRPFVSNNKTIIVLLGIDGRPIKERDMRMDLQVLVNQTINQTLIDNGADIKVTRNTVSLTVGENPTKQQKNELGQRTLYVQQYDIQTELEEVSMGLVNAVHNTVIDEVEELGFNITGTSTTVE
jgi:hypothetical protein